MSQSTEQVAASGGNPLANSSLVTQVLRWTLGVLMMLRGVMKAWAWPIFPEVLRTEYTMFPAAWSEPLAVVLLVIEIVLGVWLITGLRLPTAATVSCALLALTVGVLAIQHFGVEAVESCGCGIDGVTDRPLFVMGIDGITALLAGWLAVLSRPE